MNYDHSYGAIQEANSGSAAENNPADMLKGLDRYEFIKVLGAGAYGVVCAATDKSIGHCVAIKRIDQIKGELVARRTLRELKLLRHFRNHPNIISIFDIFTRPGQEHEDIDELFITQELMDTDMYRLTQSKYHFTDAHVQAFMYQILRGLKAVHSANVLHRDLKPGNLLWKNNGEIKICDFGLARGLGEPLDSTEVIMTNYVATRWYRPPEILLYKGNYGKALDMWSVGCIFAEFLSRKIFLPGKSGFEQLQLILQKLGTPDEHIIQRIPSERSREYLKRLPKYQRYGLHRAFPSANLLAIDLLEKMLAFDPNERISAANALKHPYLAHFHDPSREPDYPIFDFNFDAKCITLLDLKRCILDEITVSQLSQRIPTSLMPFKENPQLLHRISRDPIMNTAPTNAPQPGYSNLVGSRSRDLSEHCDNVHIGSLGVDQLNLHKDSAAQQPPVAAAKSFYQAFKRGLKRLGSLRRNNSA